METAKQRMNKRLLDGLGGEDQERQVGQGGGVFQRVQEGYQTTRRKQNLEQLHLPFQTRMFHMKKGNFPRNCHYQACALRALGLLLADIPHICHGSHGNTRVNFFWPV